MLVNRHFSKNLLLSILITLTTSVFNIVFAEECPYLGPGAEPPYYDQDKWAMVPPGIISNTDNYLEKVTWNIPYRGIGCIYSVPSPYRAFALYSLSTTLEPIGSNWQINKKYQKGECDAAGYYANCQFTETRSNKNPKK